MSAAPTKAQLREALMRCGALAISDRADGCVPRSRALRIREIAYRMCWPEEHAAGFGPAVVGGAAGLSEGDTRP